MRIVLVNWARFVDGALIGGGVNGYCHQLAIELLRLGHRVAWLQSGFTYVGAAEYLPPPQIRRLPDEAGIEQYTIVNSPVVAPGIFQAHDPQLETSCPALEALASTFFAHWKPDVVHFHNIEGLSAGCITSAVSSSAAVLFSVHNYYTLCPQVYLTRHEGDYRYPCRDYEQGHACVSCLRSQLPANRGQAEMRIRAGLPELSPAHARDDSTTFLHATAMKPDDARAERHSQGGPLDIPLAQSPGTPPTPHANHPDATDLAAANHPAQLGRLGRLLPSILLPSLHKVLVQLGRVQEEEGEVPPVQAAPEPMVPQVMMPGTAMDIAPPPVNISLDQIAADTLHARRAAQPITNDLAAPVQSHRVLHSYGQRRHVMTDALNQCHRVLAVSRFVADLYSGLGVSPSRVRVMPIGTRMAELVQQRESAGRTDRNITTENCIGAPRTTTRLAFIGYNNYYKGLGMFLDSLDLLPLNISQQIELFIWAKDIEHDRQRIDSMASRLHRIHVSGAYRYEDVPTMLSGIDAGVVPSLWWDNGPQTVMECLACRVPVLAAAVGGIVDWVRDGENGLLFRGNDRPDLARVLTRIVTQPGLLKSLADAIVPPLRMDEHARHLCTEYNSCIDQLGRNGSGGTMPGPRVAQPSGGSVHGV